MWWLHYNIMLYRNHFISYLQPSVLVVKIGRYIFWYSNDDEWRTKKNYSKPLSNVISLSGAREPIADRCINNITMYAHAAATTFIMTVVRTVKYNIVICTRNTITRGGIKLTVVGEFKGDICRTAYVNVTLFADFCIRSSLSLLLCILLKFSWARFSGLR